MGMPIASNNITSCSDTASGSSTPRLSLMALAKREAARRGLYSKFFRGPILGPDVHSETAEVEATAVGQDARADTEKTLKKNDPSWHASTEDSNKGAKKQEKLRKKVEKAAKLHRRKGKEKGVDEQDVDETIALSAPQEQASEVLAFETPHLMPNNRKKKNKRRVTSVLETPHSERTLAVEDCKDSKASRKKRRRDESL